MRLRQIEVFQAVYVNRSISGAARALNVSQPSVSKVLRHTEVQLGLSLFELVHGRLVATNEAHQLFKDVDEVYRRISSLKQTARNLKSIGAGHISVGAVTSLSLDIIPRAISNFDAKKMGITLEVQTVHFNEILRVLYERELDLVFCYGHPPRQRLASKKIGSAELVVLASSDIFPKTKTSVSIQDFSGKDFVGYNDSGTVGEFVSNALGNDNIELNQYATVGTYFTAAGIVRSCGGLTIVDEYTAASLTDERTRVLKLVPKVQFDIFVAWLEDRPLSTQAKSFVKSVEEIFQIKS